MQVQVSDPLLLRGDCFAKERLAMTIKIFLDRKFEKRQ